MIYNYVTSFIRSHDLYEFNAVIFLSKFLLGEEKELGYNWTQTQRIVDFGIQKATLDISCTML